MAKQPKTKRKALTYTFVGDVLNVRDEDSNERRSYDFSELPEGLDSKFVELGRKTKLANFAAGVESNKLGAMDEGWDRLVSGEWEKEIEKLPEWLKGKSAEIAAAAAILGKPESAVRAAFKVMDEAKGLKFLSGSKVLAKMAEMQAAATDEDDMDELLG